MAGLYIHIPFCKQACHYCNFHFSTSLKQKDKMVQAIIKEIKLQKHYLDDHTLQTVYLGGGTPSLLSEKELAIIFENIFTHYTVQEGAEITLEANPDDLTVDKIKQLANSPINRLSIGVQSFYEADLQWMNRNHTGVEAKQCILSALSAGFTQLTIDLIYGVPTLSHQMWQQNIQTAVELDIPHISCYALTVEPNTALDYFIKKGTKTKVDEKKTVQQYEVLMEQMEQMGYEHYEISNFAKPNAYARHNSSYWKGVPYLGIGPSAHSYNGSSRQWNISHNAKYIKAILTQNRVPYEAEVLTLTQQYNEYILTALRTKWGCELTKIQQWGNAYEQYFLQAVKKYHDEGYVLSKDGIFYLTRQGKHIADHISMELFYASDFQSS